MSVVREINNTDGFGGMKFIGSCLTSPLTNLEPFMPFPSQEVSIADRAKNAAAIQLKILLFMFSSIYASTAGG